MLLPATCTLPAMEEVLELGLSPWQIKLRHSSGSCWTFGPGRRRLHRYVDNAGGAHLKRYRSNAHFPVNPSQQRDRPPVFKTPSRADQVPRKWHCTELTDAGCGKSSGRMRPEPFAAPFLPYGGIGKGLCQVIDRSWQTNVRDPMQKPIRPWPNELASPWNPSLARRRYPEFRLPRTTMLTEKISRVI